MKNVKALFLCFVLIFGGQAYSPKVEAGGIPVIDVSNLFQTIQQYLQQIKEYQEALAQTALQGSQLAQLYTDYQQVLTEYQTLMRQVESIRGYLSQDALDILNQEINRAYERVGISVIPTIDPQDPSYNDDVRAILHENGLAPRETEEVLAEFRSLGATDEELATIKMQMDASNQSFSNSLTEHKRKSAMHHKLNLLDEKVKQHLEADDSFGDESQLATLQSMNRKLTTLAEQGQIEATIANEKSDGQSLTEFVQNNRAKAIEKELKRLKSVQNRQVKNGGYSNFSDLGL